MKRFESLDDCQKFIDGLKAYGLQIPPDVIDQYNTLKSQEQQIGTKTPIWDTLRANYPYGEMPIEKVRCVEEAVEELLLDGEHAEEPGLLLGNIQCGKTDTFEDIIGLSFDKGVDIAIVITKGTKALVNQTIKRMKKDYRFFKASDKIDQLTTINIYDIMDVWRSLKKVKVEGCKTVIVCKKNSVNLDHLIQLFESNSPFLKKKKVLIVDDEADFASRNYRTVRLAALCDENGKPISQTAETEMAKIAQQIDDFRKIPIFCRYLQVTATPYCLYLQPLGELNLNGKYVKPFKPRFTKLVPIHDAYIGGQQYFVDSQNQDSMYSHLFHQVDQKCIDVLGHEDGRYINASVSSGNIYGLTFALVAYFMATAVRRIQMANTKKIDYKTSAIIHVDIDKKNHDWQARIVSKLIDSIKNAIVNEDQTDQRIWTAIDVIYNDFTESNRKGRNEGLITIELPSQEDILDEIRKIFNPKKNNYHVQMVNSDEQMETLLDEESGELVLDTAATIFIGGNILDRGVTIKNMLCFFYGRNPKRFQQDTVLQHARMYGARSKEDMAVMRFHTTAHIYKILMRMNQLDEQLRQWFIDGHDKEEPNAVFIGYDKDIKPCATQKIKISNALTIRPHQRILPVGFWTDANKQIKDYVDAITDKIRHCPGYRQQDNNGFFEIDKATVIEIIGLIEKTYVYDESHENLDRKSDLKELLCALDYCTAYSNGKLFAIHRTQRDVKRIRENGCFIDAPDDGRTDVNPSKIKATDTPVIMLIQEEGRKVKDPDTGENVGWNNAPFYWPVLMTQQSLPPAMFAIDQRKKGQKAVVDISDIFDGIDNSQVLSMTYSGDLEDHFGVEGTTYSEDYPVETRALKDTTASKYIQKAEDGSWSRNPHIHFDPKHDHGIYSLNNGQFPFELKAYKYMCLRNARNASADVMLLELTDPSEWLTIPEGKLNENGDLLDRDTQELLLHGSDVIIDKKNRKTSFVDNTITQWIIVYKIRKVVKFKKNTIDWFPDGDTDE